MNFPIPGLPLHYDNSEYFNVDKIRPKYIMSNIIIFSKEDLLKITELLQEQSLSEVLHQLGLNDFKLLYEKKYNTDLEKAIQKGISLRPKNFKYKQA